MSFDPELEEFKRLDLREYAADQGYALDRKQSWRGSAVMRSRAGDKIVIKLGADGHYVYFSVRDDQDHGSIIDFIKNRKQVNLGGIRKELRAWSGRPTPSLLSFSKMEVTSKDRQAVERRFYTMQIANRHPYLEDTRKIPTGVLSAPRFAGRIRIDAKRNAVFPHFDAGGLSGYEIKNREFTGFAAGGEKGLWMSHSHDGDRRLVFAESAIDALSHAALFPDEHTRYASIGGKLNPQQPGLIRSEIAKLPNGSEVVSAVDNDADGAQIAAIIEMAVTESGREDLIYRAHFPPLPIKDWNDVLRQSRQSSFPAARF
ncbi:hypothetical protein ACPOL_6760 (plasmid) [Acidisarcina polymorpha]|uniref:DUF3991 domain-containing protein n=1 Tax=Acidisarcina polymorpha TaxID=2211140 RepID=A0A2Z5GAM2_9BACT|nr:DUF3991 and TOPRIM domain-containing protein [Acidisarcina polymorpha]AXC15970.1 hypothetical protein ACPOL_6760 [Acidisarcina polymorpha]